MRTALIRDLFQHLDADGSLQVGHCPEAASRTLEAMPLPVGVKRVLQWYWTNRGGEVGGYTLHSVEGILAHEDLPRLLAVGMLPIGYAANGDPLVLRFGEEECAVGLVSHDELWGGVDDPKEMYAEAAGSIDEYLWRAAEGRYLPIDYYAAAELRDMRQEADGGRAA